jgi:ABC-2 type transport system permease protein
MHSDSNTPPRPPRSRTLLTHQLGYQLRLIARTPRAAWGGVMLPILLLVIRHNGGDTSPTQQALIVAGAAIFGLISVAYITHATGLVSARQDGVLKRWRAAPLPRWCFFAGRVAATVLLAVASGLLTVLIAVVLYHLHMSARGATAMTLVLILGAAATAAIGTAISPLIPNTDAAWPVLGLTYIPMLFLSGAFGTTSEPHWLSQLVTYLPAQPIINAGSDALTTTHNTLIPGHDLAVLIAWTTVGLLISIRVFRWEPRPPTRRRSARTTP